MAKLVVGCGYLGERVAKRWVEQGDDVHVLTRSEERAKEFASHGLRPVIGDIMSPDSLKLPAVDAMLFAVGFDRSAGYAIEDVYVEGLRNTLNAMESVGRLVYISTTGVYSQTSGEWIDEQSEAIPKRPGGRASLEAEQLLAASDFAAQTLILRLAGIYGPGRVPNQHQLSAGEPLSVPSQGYLNLIHVDDAAQIVEQAVARLSPPQLLLVSDGHPVLRHQYYETVAELIGAPSPVFVEPDPSASATARAAADKRIRNDKLVEVLGYEFLYPSYREGLADILRGDAD